MTPAEKDLAVWGIGTIAVWLFMGIVALSEAWPTHGKRKDYK